MKTLITALILFALLPVFLMGGVLGFGVWVILVILAHHMLKPGQQTPDHNTSPSTENITPPTHLRGAVAQALDQRGITYNPVVVDQVESMLIDMEQSGVLSTLDMERALYVQVSYDAPPESLL